MNDSLYFLSELKVATKRCVCEYIFLRYTCPFSSLSVISSLYRLPRFFIEISFEITRSPMPLSTDVPASFGLLWVNTAYDVTGCEGMMSS